MNWNDDDTGSKNATTLNRTKRNFAKITAMSILILGGVLLLLVVLGGTSEARITITIRYVGNSEVQMEWSGGSYSEGDFERYDLYRDGDKIHTTDDFREYTYQDTGLDVFTAYDYLVERYMWNESHTELILWDNGEMENVTAGDVHGTMIYDTEWTKNDGPYALTGNVEALDGEILTIGVGTVIQANEYRIKDVKPNIDDVTIFDGGLIFRDLNFITVKDSTFDASAVAFSYPGLKIMNCSIIDITGCSFKGYDPGGGPHESTGIRFDEMYISPRCKDIRIRNNEFEDCHYGIFAWNLEDAEIESNIFIDTYQSIFIDDEFKNSSFSSNEIKRDTDPYDRVQGGWVVAVDCSIFGNTFTGIDQYFTMKGSNSTFYQNIMTNCSSGIEVMGTNQEVFWNTVTGSMVIDNGRGMGIRCAGEGLKITENEVSNFGRGGIYTSNDVIDSTIARNNITGCDVGFYSNFLGPAGNVTIENNRILNSKEDGILIQSSQNNTIRNNFIQDNDGNGIWLQRGCYDNTILGNTITGTGHNGIYVGWDKGSGSNERNLIEGNTISDSDRDIRIEGRWDVNYKYILGDNNTIHNNVLSGSYYGIYIEGASNNTFTNNSITDMVMRGIEIDYYYTSSWKMYAHSMNNKFENNRITTQKGIGREVYEKIMEPTNTQWVRNIHGNTYPTTLSMSGFNTTYFGRGVDDPPALPQPPDHPSKNVNISNFFELWYKGGPYDMTFHYTNEQLGELKEENLWVWRYNWSGTRDNGTWVEDRDKTVWLDVWGNYIERNDLEVKIRNSSGWMLYAPLIAMPVHNIDTEEDYNTIQDAIADEKTLNGHTIVVDPSYTLAETKENLDIYKKITLMSSSGGPAINTIQAENEDLDVIFLSVDGVTIKGFTIRGATSQRGVYRLGSLDDILIENCHFADNYNGIVFTELTSRGGRGRATYHEIMDCSFEGNSNAGILLNGTSNSHVTDSTFTGNAYGLALQDGDACYVVGCTFEEDLEIGLYVIRGSDHSLTGNEFIKCPTGMRIEYSSMNTAELTEGSENGIGVHIFNSDENTLLETTIEKLGDIGIALEESGGNTIRNLTITGSAGGANIGIDILRSDSNEITGAEIRNINTVGFGATGIRIHQASSLNEISETTIDNLESSNSTGILMDASLNEIRDTVIQRIITYGVEGSAGMFFYPHANGNSIARLTIDTMEGNDTNVGVDLIGANENVFTDCEIMNVESTAQASYGFRYRGVDSGTVKHTTFVDLDVAFHCEGGSEPTFHWNTFALSSHFGVQNVDTTVTVNAENNFWGDSSGPGGEGPGTGTMVSKGVDYDPWIGASTASFDEETVQPGTGTVDSKLTSDTEVDYETTEERTITTQQYVSNPAKGVSGDLGKYIDVHLDSSDGVSEITIKMYYTSAELGNKDETKLKMYWWNGQNWLVCSDSGVNTLDTGNYAGYIWAKVRSDTSPSLTEMTGTPFGASDDGTGEDPGDDDDGFPIGSVIIGIVVILLMAAIGMYLVTENKKPDNEESPEVGEKKVEEKDAGEEKEEVSGKEKESGEPDLEEKSPSLPDPKSQDPETAKMTKADIIEGVLK